MLAQPKDKPSALKATCVCSCSFMLESYQIFTATHDKWHQKLTDITKFWHWIHWMTAQPHFSPKQMLDNSAAVLPPSHMMPWNIINPRVPLLEFPSFPPKFLTWRQNATHMAWSFEQSFSLFQFHSSLFLFFSNFPVWSLLLVDPKFQPSRFLMIV